MMDKSIHEATDREIAQEIGRRLRALRKARRWSLLEVAELSELDRTTIARAERGENPTLRTIIRLLRTYRRLGALESFIPEPEISPMQLIRESRRKKRPRP